MHVTMYDDMAIQWMFEIFEIQKAQEVSEQRVQYVFEEPKIMPLISFYLFVVCFENWRIQKKMYLCKPRDFTTPKCSHLFEQKWTKDILLRTHVSSEVD